MVTVKRFGKTVGDILFGRKRLRRILRRALRQNPVLDAPRQPGLQQSRKPFAPQLRRQRRRNEPFGSLHLGRAHRKNRIAAFHGLRPQGGGVRFGIIRRLQRNAAFSDSRHPFAVGIAERHTLRRRRHHDRSRNHAPRTAPFEQLVEAVVVIAVDLASRSDPFHAVGRHAVAVGSIDIGSDQSARRQEADAVAGGQRMRPVEPETGPFDARHAARIFADRLRRVERRHASTFARKEVFRLPAGETLGRIGREVRDAFTGRSTPQVRPRGQCIVHRAAVIGHRIADIIDVFETPLYFQRPDAGIQQLADVCRKIQVADREQVFSGQIGAPAAVGQVIGQAARLAACAAVAAPLGHRPRQKTAAAVTHADGPVDETLHFGVRRGAYRPDLVERQRPFENHAGETAFA